MFECKLCHGDKYEPSSADKNMCRKCYRDLTRYRRYKMRDNRLDTYQVALIKRMETLFALNHAKGGYVPKDHGGLVEVRRCATCNMSFEAISKVSYCDECRKREVAYRTLLKNNPTSPRVHKYEAYYTDARNSGMRVPLAFTKRYR